MIAERYRLLVKDHQPIVARDFKRMVGDIEIAYPIDRQRTWEAEHIHIGLTSKRISIRCEESTLIALASMDIILTKHNVHDGTGKRVTDAQYAMIICVTQPEEITFAHRRDAENAAAKTRVCSH